MSAVDFIHETAKLAASNDGYVVRVEVADANAAGFGPLDTPWIAISNEDLDAIRAVLLARVTNKKWTMPDS